MELIEAGIVKSAHDCSDGGLAVALAECCFSSYRREGVGATIDLSGHASLTADGLGKDRRTKLLALLFGESPSRMIVTVNAQDVNAVGRMAEEQGVPYSEIGRVGGSQLSIELEGSIIVRSDVDQLESRWRGAVAEWLDRPVTSD